jgi:hypothetical protein
MTNLIDILSSYSIIWQSFTEFWWLILPWPLWAVFKIVWMDYVTKVWANSLQWTMLDVIPPKDLERGPKLMEAIYQVMSGVVVSYNAFEEYILGMFTDRFSMELVGIDGKVHFYIRTQKRYQNLIEAQIYSQYPDAQILEVNDYTKSFPAIVPNRDWNLWGSDLELSEPAPFPIRTYDKFEEDVTGELIDPMAAFVELLGSLGLGQHMWIQFVIKPEGEVWRQKQMKYVEKLAGREKEEEKGVLGHFADVLANLFNALWGPVEFAGQEKKEQQPLEFRLTPGEKDQLKALEENLSKNMYTVKVRFVYLGKKEGFDMANVTAFFGVMRQFNDLNTNNLKPENWSKTYAHFVNIQPRLYRRKRKLYKRYKDRDMDGKKVVFSTSELATLFHFPDMSVKGPAMQKVESKRGSAPSNLPVA